MSFAENLARIQAERGVTNYRIAKEIDVNQTSIVNWKNGTKPHPRNGWRTILMCPWTSF